MATSTTWLGKARGAYYGWRVLASTFLLGAVSGGIFSHSNGIFFGPIKQDLGLSSAQASLIFSLTRAEGVSHLGRQSSLASLRSCSDRLAHAQAFGWMRN